MLREESYQGDRPVPGKGMRGFSGTTRISRDGGLDVETGRKTIGQETYPFACREALLEFHDAENGR